MQDLAELMLANSANRCRNLDYKTSDSSHTVGCLRPIVHKLREVCGSVRRRFSPKMSLKVGMNGTGRNTRNFIRIVYQQWLKGDHSIKLVAINDPCITSRQLVLLLKYDSTHGRFPGAVRAESEDKIVIGDGTFIINFYREKRNVNIPWSESEVEMVIESTNLQVELSDTRNHIRGTVKKAIVISYSSDSPKFVCGVNEKKYDPRRHHVICSASPTSICTSLLAQVLEDKYGVESSLLTTVHSTTASQKIVDGYAMKATRDGRAVNQNIIPTPTNMARCIGKLIPSLDSHISGMSYRVPVSNVSCADLNVNLKNPCGSVQELIQCFEEAAQTKRYKGKLDVNWEPLVSSDYNGSGDSCTLDALSCMQITPTFYKIIAWYDNEIGYIMRVIDLIKYVVKCGLDVEGREEQKPTFYY